MENEQGLHLTSIESLTLMKYLESLGFPNIPPVFSQERWAVMSAEFYLRFKAETKGNYSHSLRIGEEYAVAIRRALYELPMVKTPEIATLGDLSNIFDKFSEYGNYD